MLEKGWASMKDILKELSGEYEYPQDESEIISTKADKQFILLIFIGGITYGELAGIRYLNSKLRNKKFIIITTNMINSKKLFDQMKKGKYTYTPVDPNDKSNIVLTFKEAFNQLGEKMIEVSQLLNILRISCLKFPNQVFSN